MNIIILLRDMSQKVIGAWMYTISVKLHTYIVHTERRRTLKKKCAVH
jgi:hypothetical protein